MADDAKFAAEEAAYICRHLVPDLDIDSIRARAKETFDPEKG